MRERLNGPKKIGDWAWKPTDGSGPPELPSETGNDALLIISVQSQKGGVGKSTAALALADLLSSDEKYNVLVIDADITGTNLALAVESSFWSDRMHIVREENNEGAKFDLADHFVRKYLTGTPLPSFSGETKSVHLAADLTSPNVMGSSFPFNAPQGTSNVESMFNDFFSPLFLEYVEGLALGFHQTVKARKGNREFGTVIVIDNSPGHVGLVTELVDYLTDVGPATAKILFVTTPDIHDLEAVAQFASSTFSRMQSKWEVSRAFMRMKEQETSENQQKLDRKLLDGQAGQFFLALAEAEVRAEAETEVEKLPRSEKSELPPPLNPLRSFDFFLDRIIPGSRESMVREPKWSIGALVNLVPECMLEEISRAPAERLGEILLYRHQEPQMAEASAQQDRSLDILGLARHGSARRFVPFDPSMRDQYMNRTYSVVSSPHSGNFQQLDEVLGRLSRRARPLGGEQDGLRYGNMRAITVAIDLANRAVDALALHGSGYGRALVRSAWLPSTILTLLRDLSHSLLPELEIEITARDFEELAERSSEVRSRASKLSLWLKENLPLDTALSKQTIDLIAETLGLAVEVASHKAIPVNDTRIHQTALAIVRRQRDAIGSRMSEGKGRLPRVRFTSKFLGYQFRQALDTFESALPPLDAVAERSYLLCCEAEARILDLRADVEFLFRILRALAELNPGNTIGSLRVSSIARRVIQTKETKHEYGLNQLAQTQVSERQLTAFEDALRSIIQDWGIP